MIHLGTRKEVCSTLRSFRSMLAAWSNTRTYCSIAVFFHKHSLKFTGTTEAYKEVWHELLKVCASYWRASPASAWQDSLELLGHNSWVSYNMSSLCSLETYMHVCIYTHTHIYIYAFIISDYHDPVMSLSAMQLHFDFIMVYSHVNQWINSWRPSERKFINICT